MAFVKNRQLQVGDKARTTRVFSNFAGHFEVGSIVTVTEIGTRGYTIKDEEGNVVRECGFSGLEPLD